MKETKIVVIGGGSSYTPELAEGLIKRMDTLKIKDLWLVDINDGDGPKKLDIVHGLIQRMFKAAGLDTNVHKTLDRKEALEGGADYIVTQFRVGRMEARVKDERISLKHGFIGQETNGAGGLFKGLRTIPVVFDILDDVKRMAPEAWVINFANPSGMVTQAVSSYNKYDKFIGVCNVPINARIGVANLIGKHYNDIKYSAAGLNHLVYFTHFWDKTNGENITQKVLDAGRDAEQVKKLQPANVQAATWDSNLINTLNALPCGYHRYYYNKGEVLKEYLEHFEKGTTRAEEVQRLEESLFEKYKDPNLTVKPKELESRGGAHYSEVACSVINAIHTDSKQEFVVGVQNNGHVKNFPNGLVVEATSVIGKDGAKPVQDRTINMPDASLGLVHTIKTFELLAIEAAVEGKYEKGLGALQINPLSENSFEARELFNELLEAHKKYIPNIDKPKS